MTELLKSLYKLFDLQPSCTDEELRRAYRKTLLIYHPDKNPFSIDEMTLKTQKLTSAYIEIKNKRKNQNSNTKNTNEYENDLNNYNHYGFPSSEDVFNTMAGIPGIDEIKSNFKKLWEEYSKNTYDTILTLKMLHCAFQAERQNYFINLLLNHVLIDSASLLFSIVNDNNKVSKTITKWSIILKDNKKPTEAIQILEDALKAVSPLLELDHELCNQHYAWANYLDPITNSKPTPEVRLAHLLSLIEHGYKPAFIYKKIGDTYRELGNIEEAKIYHKEACRLNPNLSGAEIISKSIDHIIPSNFIKVGKKTISHYKYSSDSKIPSYYQIFKWKEENNWDAIIDSANVSDYSPRLVSSYRDLFSLLASTLGECKSKKAIEALIKLQNFKYWDVSEAAIVSLSKIGDADTLAILNKYSPSNQSVRNTLNKCISYLQARLQQSPGFTSKDSSVNIALAKRYYSKQNYGQARIVLEYLLSFTEDSDPLYIDAVLLLSGYCAEMSDLKVALDLITPILHKIPIKIRYKAITEVGGWLWSYLLTKKYAQIDDQYYFLALDINFELVQYSASLGDMLSFLWRLTRWLEILNEKATANWIRDLIRLEAPGTVFVDSYNREQYFKNVNKSPPLVKYLNDFRERIQILGPLKIRQFLHTHNSLKKKSTTE